MIGRDHIQSELQSAEDPVYFDVLMRNRRCLIVQHRCAGI